MPSIATLLAFAAAVPAALACLGYEGGIPKTSGSKSLSEPMYIGAGKTFDANWVKYDRGSGACASGEGGEADAVFVLEDGATLKNVVIGADQQEGVYCLGACDLIFVWFEDVCEDAISIKGDGTANIIGGGAYGAEDKVIQHNGCGHVNVRSQFSDIVEVMLWFHRANYLFRFTTSTLRTTARSTAHAETVRTTAPGLCTWRVSLP